MIKGHIQYLKVFFFFRFTTNSKQKNIWRKFSPSPFVFTPCLSVYRSADSSSSWAAGLSKGADKEQEEVPGGRDNGAGCPWEGRSGRQVRTLMTYFFSGSFNKRSQVAARWQSQKCSSSVVAWLDIWNSSVGEVCQSDNLVRIKDKTTLFIQRNSVCKKAVVNFVEVITMHTVKIENGFLLNSKIKTMSCV